MNEIDRNFFANQPWPARIVTAIFYPLLNLIAFYAAVLFFSLAADALSMQDKG